MLVSEKAMALPGILSESRNMLLTVTGKYSKVAEWIQVIKPLICFRLLMAERALYNLNQRLRPMYTAMVEPLCKAEP